VEIIVQSKWQADIGNLFLFFFFKVRKRKKKKKKKKKIMVADIGFARVPCHNCEIVLVTFGEIKI